MSAYFKKEEQVLKAVDRAKNGQTEYIYYLLGNKFKEGLKGMVTKLGEEDLYYVFKDLGESSNKEDSKYGDVVAFKIVNKKGMDMLVIYTDKNGLFEIVFKVNKTEKGHGGISREVGTRGRKPNHFNTLLQKRNKLYSMEVSKTKGEEKDSQEVKVVSKVLEIIKGLEEDGAERFEVFGIKKLGKSSKFNRKEFGFGVEGYNSEGVVNPSGATMFTLSIEEDLKKTYGKVSKLLYKEVNSKGIKLVNNVNKEKGIVYIKTK